MKKEKGACAPALPALKAGSFAENMAEEGASALRFEREVLPPLRSGAFSGCLFAKCRIFGHHRLANFEDVLFSGCDLSNAVFYGCGFSRVRFEGCKLLGLRMEESLLSDLVLSECMARDLSFSDCRLRRAEAADCDLSGAGFYRVGLKEIGLQRVSLSGAEFFQTPLEGVTSPGATCPACG